MKRYSELLQAKADQEKADFEMRQAEINRLNKLMRESRMRFEGMMSAYFRPEFTSFVKEITEHKFFAEYSEVQDAGLTKRAQVLFRLHHDEDEVPLNRTDCCVWIELDAANGIVNWDYHGDLQVHEDHKLPTGKLGDLDAECIVALPNRLTECLAACLEGRRVTTY
ncbi:TPA: hypothetical protein QDB24_003443 [Burkholderia vietnamiensis]|uniref:hypothetical protein n=1 Tax=Burkholderia vietnamiensis TaxID=60552 RepID=UPI001B971AB3|nr:hypothetical protein [Burkholderia vietnamiensis]MBR7911228.1 hypothetical protein [Burkholderia vietnamiensis]HDR9275351.1 hypothetical protein [Burkholderia vietnamiensis]